MQYEIYIDSLFAVNFCMDYLLLALSAKLLGIAPKRRFVALGALVGTVITLMLLFLVGIALPLRMLLAYGASSILMMRIVMGKVGFMALLRGALILYLMAFVMGGGLEFLQRRFGGLSGQGFKTGIMVALAYGLYRGISWLWEWYQKSRKEVCYPVTLCLLGTEIALHALYDTGNSLVEPVSGKPVLIVEKGVLGELAKRLPQERYRAIPYHSIGKTGGIMNGYMTGSLRIQTKEAVIVREDIVIGIYEGTFGGGRYQMILHPQNIP